jgi:DNA replication protein DnaC
MADCTYHPGEDWIDCRKCLIRDADEQRAQALADAAAACDQRFPIRYRDAVTEREDVLMWAKAFAADPAGARSLLLLGPTGTGKTHHAYGAVRAATSVALPTRAGGYRPPRWVAMTYAELTATLRPRGRDYDPEAVLEKYRRTELLFIDDLGAAKATEFVEEATYRLINGRYEDMRPGIFTTNLALPELKDAIGDRIASRLAETCIRVVLEGPDRRRTKREPQ